MRRVVAGLVALIAAAPLAGLAAAPARAVVDVPTGYAWDFGDGSVATDAATTHTYDSPGQRTVTLTVTDNDGMTGQTARQINPSIAAVSFVGAASAKSNKIRHTVTVPPTVQVGDALLLFFAGNSSTPSIPDPPGWTPLRQSDANGAVGRLWGKVATAGDAGSVAAVSASSIIKADITVAAYRGTSGDPIAASAAANDANRSTHTTPTITTSVAGAWLLSYWADKSSTATAWTLPAGTSRRAATTGNGSGYITATLADSNAGLPAGAAGGLTATTGITSSKAVMFSVVLAPS